MKSFFKPLTIILFGTFLVIGACDEGAGNAPGLCDNCSSTSPDGPPPDPDTAEELYVKFLDSADGNEVFEYFEYEVLPSFDVSKTCRVTKGETSNKDLSCVVDVNEQDLYFHGMRIEFVIPTGMCDYFTFSNYWHYDQEVGTGPPGIWIRKYVNDVGEPSGNPECFVQNSDGNWYPSDPTADGLPADGGVLGTGDNCASLSANAGLELYNIDPDSSTPFCRYDQSPTGTNCCRGRYNLYIETVDNQNGTGDPPNPIGKGTEPRFNIEYGNQEYGNCISGTAVVDSNWPKTVNGIPMRQIWYTREKGLSDRYEIPAPNSINNEADNHLVSNWHAYVEGTDTRHDHQGNINARVSYLPIFIDPIEDRSGDFFHIPGQPSYEFRCMNEDLETIHRMRWYIREYNSEAQFQNFIANPVNGSQDADRNGVEGGAGVNDCEGFLGDACNDRTDPDDFVPDVPGDTPPYDCSSSEGARFSGGSCFPYSRD
ncbi:MAG: hypothetical protein KDD58_08680 [Bdellovibrionales bacterium]|nr:hypothetical protein [Bdellovibrionales bacterium]